MTTICVVQARTGSTRLPGKVVAELGGTTVLAFLLRRLGPLSDASVPVVVATSTGSGDDVVADIAAQEDVAVVRGSEADVLGRFGLALDAHPADHVVRLTGDCPLSDPALVLETIARAERTMADYTSNTLIRTFPDGLDVEVMTASALRIAVAEAVDDDEREHVTPFLYRQPGRFRLEAVTTSDLLGQERWTLDTAEDLDVIRRIVDRLPDPVGAGWRAVLAVTGRGHPPPADASHLVPDVSVPLVDGRAWLLQRRDQTLGRLIVTIHDRGEGRLDLSDVPPEHHERAADLVALALRQDLQVRRLQRVP